MRGGLLDLIGVWVLGKEKGREIEKEREGYGVCVCIEYCLKVEDYQVFFGEK